MSSRSRGIGRWEHEQGTHKSEMLAPESTSKLSSVVLSRMLHQWGIETHAGVSERA